MMKVTGVLLSDALSTSTTAQSAGRA